MPHKKKILIVEDQNPHMFRELLEAYNDFEYIVANPAKGDQPLDIFREQFPDLVLMDIRLPKMNGLELTRQIRKFDLVTPIIIFTAYADAGTRGKAMAAGATEFWAKPFDYGRLHKRMFELICERTPAIPLDQHRQTILIHKRRRLRYLEERQAILGLSTPVETVMEIEDLQNDIAELEAGTE